jgi:PAS domain S-box-containing protein
MRAVRVSRTTEELVLLAVAAGSAGVVVSSLVRDAPPTLAFRAATTVALALALLSAFAFWFAGAVRRSLAESARRDREAAEQLLAALPEGMVVVADGLVVSVNRRFCELVGYPRDDLVGAEMPFPFWPPEHRHEIEGWHDRLASGDAEAVQLVFCRRDGERVTVHVAAGTLGDAVGTRHVLTVRDVTHVHRRIQRLAELSSRDPETALLNERGFEEQLREAVRQALAGGGNVSVALLELDVRGTEEARALATPQGQVLVRRLGGLVRTGEAVARVRGNELAWILPATSAAGAEKAVARLREELADVVGVAVTAGICDLETAGDALSLYAFADRALVTAKRQGSGTTAAYPDAWPDDLDELARTLVG